MKKLIVAILLALIVLSGCRTKNNDKLPRNEGVSKDFIDEKDAKDTIKLLADKDYVYYDKSEKAPIINIDSKDAEEINAELKSIFNASTYLEHEKIINDNFVSIIIKSKESELDKIYTYVFDIDSGKLLSQNDLLEKFEILENGMTLIENSIVSYVDGRFNDSECTQLSTLEGMALREFFLNYGDKIPLFIDEDGTLNIYGKIYNGNDLLYEKIPILIDKNVPNSLTYETLEKFKRDDETLGYAAFLGYGANDEKRSNEAIQRAEKFLGEYQIDEKIYHKLLEPIEKEKLMDEMHLIIPRYKNSVVIVKFIDPINGASDDPVYETINRGPRVEFGNISEIAPNLEVTIIYRDKSVTYSPGISLKDGSNFLPNDNMVDITDNLN